MTDATGLLDSLPDAVVVADAAGTIRWANQAAGRLAEQPPGALVGRGVADLFDAEPKDGDAAATVRGRPVIVNRAPAPGGARYVFREREPWTGRERERDPGELDTALGAVFQAALSVSGGEFEGEEDFSAIAQALASAGRRLLPATECLISLLDPARPGFFVASGVSGPWADRLRGRAFQLDGSMAGQAVAARATVETSDAQRRSVLGPILAEGAIRTARVVPILVDEPLPDGRAAVGTIGFYSRRARPFTERQRRLIDDFAALVRFSLLRASLRRAARLAGKRLDMGVSLAADLGRSLQPREVVGRLLERLLDVVDCERAVLLRVEDGDTVTEDGRDRAGRPDEPGFRHPIAAQPLMLEAVSTSEPVIGGAYRAELVSETLSPALAEVRHTLTVPLVLRGEPVAVLVLSRRRDAEFGPDEVAAARLAGNIAVLALRNSWLYAEAEEASRQKSDFLNLAAHELRTPFTVVSGYLSMLSDGSLGPLPEAMTRPMATLAAKSAELGHLVEDLLIAARLDSGGMPVHRDVVDLVAAARQALERAEPRAALAGADIDLDAGEPCHAVGDLEQTARILDNLLNNSLSYSSGSPWVRVRVRRAGAVTRVEVEDRGRGISEKHLGRIFERFYRAEDPGQAQPPGTGLGLFISRQLAERMGGTLALEWTRPGEGSRFVLALPSVQVES